MTPRRVLLAWLVAMIAVHVVVGLWQPLQADDWQQLLWDTAHDGGWLGSHFTVSDMASYAFAHSTPLFAVVSGLASAALVLGAFVLAARRLPRATWDDTVGVIAISALIWIAQPRAGFVWFHRPHVAAQVIGCAAAVWLLAPLRCGWKITGRATVALVVAALIAGTSTRQIALGSLVGLGIGMRRTPAARGRLWIVLGALVAATALGFADPPYVTTLRVLNRGLEPNLLILNLPLRNSAGVVSLLLLLALARLAIAAWRPGAVTADAERDALPVRETRAWLFGWLGLCVAALFGPRYGEATLLPATIALGIGALPYVHWLGRVRALRIGLLALFVAIHAVLWTQAVTTFAPLHREFEDRIARLRATPPGQVAVVAPYARLRPDAWFYGEDWDATARQLAGIELFGVRDIDFAYPFSGYEPNAGIALHLELQGPAGAQRLVPAMWATDVIIARSQFERFARRAAHATGAALTARLIVDDPRLAFPERRARPLDAVWSEHGKLTSPRSARTTTVDVNDRVRVSVDDEVGAAFPEVYAVHGGAATHLAYADSSYKVTTVAGGMYAIVACNPTRCLLVDAFVPRM